MMSSKIVAMLVVAFGFSGVPQMDNESFFETYLDAAKRLANVQWVDGALQDRTYGSDRHVQLMIADVHQSRFIATLLYEKNGEWNLWRGGQNRDIAFQVECNRLIFPERISDLLNSLPDENLEDETNIGRILHGEVVSLTANIGRGNITRRYYFNSQSGAPTDLSVSTGILDFLAEDCASQVERAMP